MKYHQIYIRIKPKYKNHRRYKSIFCVILHILLLFSVVASASPDKRTRHPQSINISFDHINIEDGLSDAHVTKIIQDHQGFIWFATLNGLNRYDGYSIKVYKYDAQDTTSLLSNGIYCMYEDSRNNLWIGTESGMLSRYNRKTNSFIHHKAYNDLPKTKNSRILSITEDKAGSLWIGTENDGIYRISDHGVVRQIPHRINDSVSLDGVIYRSFVTDAAGNIILSTWKNGLFTFNKDLQQFQSYLNDADFYEQIKSGLIEVIYIDSQSRLWIGTLRNGLFQYNKDKHAFIHYKLGSVLGENRIKSVCEDQSGNIWIGTENGLHVLQPGTGEIHKFNYNYQSPTSLSDNYVQYVYKDNQNIVWIGTNAGGINIYNPNKIQFPQVFEEINYSNDLRKKYVKSIFQDSDENIWIGTDYGLFKYNRSCQFIREYHYESNMLNGLNKGGICGIYEDKDGLLWIGTWGGGLHSLNTKTKKFTQFRVPSSSLTENKMNSIRTMLGDSLGNIWYGTVGGGLVKFNIENRTYDAFSANQDDPFSLSSDYIHSLLTDSQGDLWIGTGNGLNRLKNGSMQFTKYFHNKGDTTTISNNSILSILEDHNRNIWIGTKDGLNLYFRDNDQFIRYRKPSILKKSVIQAIVEFDNHLWLSTIRGIIRFNPNTFDVKYYDHRDGVIINAETGLKTTDNKLLFGGVNGINSLDPSKIKENKTLPPIVFTDFKIFNQSVSFGETKRFSTHIQKANEIVLTHDQSFITFEFAALNYTLPDKNQYAYKLQGFSDEWFYIGTNRSVSFAKLPQGHYVLWVKASNNDGYWNNEGTSIRLRILPPPWKTWWAYSIYMVAILSILLLIRRFVQNREKLKNQILLDQIEADKARELSRKQNEVNQLKIRFFTNISHEFRTPLTLILSPLDNILKSIDLQDEIKKQLNLVQRNARRLLRLINQLLDLSKLEGGFMPIELRKGNILHCINNILSSFDLRAEETQIDYKYNLPKNEVEVYFDDDKIEKILYNILSNAFKYTPEKGRICCLVEFLNRQKTPIRSDQKMDQPAYVLIEVTDSGKGIPMDKLEYLYKHFYRLDNSTPGSGIGLSLVYQLVQLLHGEINARNLSEGGAGFRVIIPVEKSFFDESQVIDDELPYKNIQDDVSDNNDSESSKKKTNLEKLESWEDEVEILVIEDNPDIRTYISLQLSKKYRITEAENGVKGHSLALETLPEIIILDIMMSDMNGIELCQKLKEDTRTSHIPIILLTAKSSKEDIMEGYKTGADDYITKPFDIGILESRIENLIETRKKLRDLFSGNTGLALEKYSSGSVDQKFINNMIQAVKDDISNPEFSVEQLVEKAGMSRAQLYRKLSALTGLPVKEFIRLIRIKTAAELILKNQYTISEITYMVGFKDPSYFAKCFRKQYNCLPSEYNRLHN